MALIEQYLSVMGVDWPPPDTFLIYKQEVVELYIMKEKTFEYFNCKLCIIIFL